MKTTNRMNHSADSIRLLRNMLTLMNLFLVIAFGPTLFIAAILGSVYYTSIKTGSESMKDSFSNPFIIVAITLAYVISTFCNAVIIKQI